MQTNSHEISKDNDSLCEKLCALLMVAWVALMFIAPLTFLLLIITGQLDKKTAEYMGKALMYGPH